MTPQTSMRTPLLELRKVSKIYGSGASEVRALVDIDLSINAGEFIAIMGPSGSGKSTCMNVLGCLDTPSTGSYLFDGRRVERCPREELALLRRLRLGFVFQSFHLLPRASALENVELPLRYRGLPAAARRQRALSALARVGLNGREQHEPKQLSGGQQQRVAIARALVGEPSVVLADEPTGNLDSARAREIMELLCSVAREGITVVMVTHEPDMAAYASRVLHFRDGRLVGDGASERSVSNLEPSGARACGIPV